MKVCVIGAGTMGNGMVQAFAQSGIKVGFTGARGVESAVKGRESISKGLDRLVAKEKINEDRKNEILDNIIIEPLEEAVKGAYLVVEATREDMQIKKDLFTKLESICDEGTILATNTSSLSLTEIASVMKGEIIGMHFFNPAPIMKLVEVIKTPGTSDETTNKVLDLCKQIGKEPVVVKEYPGFVVNRVLIPMINEAIDVLNAGVASPEDIDTAMKLGANFPIGPLALSDLIGNDVVLAIMNVLDSKTDNDKYKPSELLIKMVNEDKLGRKTKEGFYKY